jgi:uncharacterized protein (DUF2147 family)
MKKTTLFSFLFSLLMIAQATVNDDELIGIWKPSNGRSLVKIEKIGNKYYGRVVWLSEPNNEDGTVRTDINNPDESLRTTPLKGYRLMKDLMLDEKEKVWTGGTIYDPNNGSTYNCTIEIKDDSTIEVRGYIGTAIFGRTDVWKRMKRK